MTESKDLQLELEEIRLNKYYCTRSVSKFPDGENGDSTPILNRNTIRTPELMNKIQKYHSMLKTDYQVDHLFPPNCRYYEKHPEGFFVVIEEPPAFRTISIDKDLSSEIQSLKSSGHWEEYGYENWQKENHGPPYQFTLALPYTVFCLAFTESYDHLGGQVFFRTQQITGFSDILLKAPFLNISDSHNICFGNKIHHGPKRSIYADVNHAISTFWSTIFNTDYLYNYVAYQNIPLLCDYFTWQYHSNIDPMFIYSADWIKEKDITIGTQIDRMKAWLSERSCHDHKQFEYRTLKDLFQQSSEKGRAKVPGVKGLTEPLLFDISNSMKLGENVYVSVGDSFKNNYDQMIYVDSYMGFRKSPRPLYISLERHDGRIFKWKLTKKVCEYIAEKIKAERHLSEATLPNGLVIKSGDILEMKNAYGQNIYRKIFYIRYSRTGEVEARVGAEYYIVNNIEKDTQIFDVSNPKYFDMTLSKDEQYYIIKRDHFDANHIIKAASCNFDSIDTGRDSGGLVMKFRENRGLDQGHRYNIPIGSNENTFRKIYPMDNLKTLPEIFTVGRRLMYIYRETETGSIVEKEPTVIPNLGIVIEYACSIRKAASDQIVKHNFIQDDRFALESWNHVYDFEIGDKVVVANWENPIDMLTVKQIQGFVEDKNTGDISFTLVDKNENVTSYKYIDGAKRLARLGSVRKITNVWGELTSGMKIVANQARISMFPKKDTNIIIGFLYDTGGEEPLVLCSNANTLWYSDVINNFDIIKMDDEAWKTKQHASINPSKMRYQSGDILQGQHYYKNDIGYLVYIPRDQRTVRASSLAYYQSYDDNFVFDKSFTEDVMFDIFPNPRLTVTQENKLGLVNVFPNFHGMFTKTDESHSPYKVANDRRSILNDVSSDN